MKDAKKKKKKEKIKGLHTPEWSVKLSQVSACNRNRHTHALHRRKKNMIMLFVNNDNNIALCL